MFSIKKEAEEMYEQMRAWREDFHRHPELGYDLERTAGIVAAHLKSLGLEVTEHVGKSGVVALLKGGKPGKVLAMRADMDALPIPGSHRSALRIGNSGDYACMRP